MLFAKILQRETSRRTEWSMVQKFSDEVSKNGEVFKQIGGMEAPLGKMKNGKKEGKWMLWNDNGTKKEEQYFKNGRKDGHWKIYRKMVQSLKISII